MNRALTMLAILSAGTLTGLPASADDQPNKPRAEEPSKPQAAEAAAKSPYRIVPEQDRQKIIAIDLNARGDLLAYRWTPENGDENVLEQAPILFEKSPARETRIPLMKGYTATFPAAVSDSGMVVGRASRPLYDNQGRRVLFSGVAFVWDAKDGIRNLGTLPEDTMSHADGVSADGNFISGISIGQDRIRACVWERDGDTWKSQPLPQETNHLNTQIVVISPNGKYVAAVDGLTPVLWTRQDDGKWTREAIGEAVAMHPRAVNDDAIVVGLRHNRDDLGTRDAVIWSRKEGMKSLEKPKGYIYAELLGVDSRGVAVGFVDGPHGSVIGPNACVAENGKLRILTEFPEFSTATAINDKGEVAGMFEEPEHAEPGPEIDPPAKPKLLPNPAGEPAKAPE